MLLSKLLAADGPMDFAYKIPLRSVGDPLSPIFPPTYPDDKQRPSYNISPRGFGRNCCAIDSHGSQVNRLEQLFQNTFPELVQQITIGDGTDNINILQLGHRVADATARSAEGVERLRTAVEHLNQGNALTLAKLVPTSLLFGFWDSRETHTKRASLIQASVRAYDVHVQTRSAQFIRSDMADSLIEEMGMDNKKFNSDLSAAGFLDCPSTGKLGGVIVEGEIFRELIVAIGEIRKIKATTPHDTKDLQEYLLGLALVAVGTPADPWLRQGCVLVPDLDAKSGFARLDYRDGRKEDFDLTKHYDAILAETRELATKFVGKPETWKIILKNAKEVVATAKARKAKKNGEEEEELS